MKEKKKGLFPFRSASVMIGSQLLKYSGGIIWGIAVGIVWELAIPRKSVNEQLGCWVEDPWAVGQWVG